MTRPAPQRLRCSPGALVLGLVLWGVLGSARGSLAATQQGRQAASQEAVVASSARACPKLFGSPARRHANHARRSEQLHFIDQDVLGVVVAHSSQRWRRPLPLSIQGISLVDTDGPVAVVELDQALAGRIGCEGGRYRLRVDDSIGRARILGVLQHGLLVEEQDRLGYLDDGDGPRPGWMMVWGSRYELQLAHQAGAKTQVRAPARPKPAPPKPKPRPRPRRR